MSLLNRKSIAGGISALLLAALTPAANAAISILDTPGTEASPFSVGGVSGVTYSTATSQLADRIAYGTNADFNPQSPTNIGLGILSVFSLPGAIYLSSYTDGTTQYDAVQTGNGAKAGTFASDYAFKYLAVHFGNNELVFDFSSTGGIAAGVAFSLGNLPNGLSNWRAYNTTPVNPDYPTPIGNPAPVPLPAAAWLFGSALIGLGSMKIGNKKRAV